MLGLSAKRAKGRPGDLGIGTAEDDSTPTAKSLSAALRKAPTSYSRRATAPASKIVLLGVPRRHALGVVVLSEIVPEQPHGLRVDLADAGLGDAEHLTDLGQRETFEVVQGDDDLLPLGE
jgi:hypothetical protein